MRLMQLRKPLNDNSRTKYQNKNYTIKSPQYKVFRDKFGKTIDSQAFKEFRMRDDLRKLNVLKYQESNDILAQIVKESKHMQDDSLPIDVTNKMVSDAYQNHQ